VMFCLRKRLPLRRLKARRLQSQVDGQHPSRDATRAFGSSSALLAARIQGKRLCPPADSLREMVFAAHRQRGEILAGSSQEAELMLTIQLS